MKRQLKQIFRKGRNQILKDYVVYPALAGRQWKTVLAANVTANLIRNLWSYVIIFCGHFPDGALHFTEEEIEDETRSEWYLRQILGAANFEGGPLLHIMSGNLGFQIEHHLFPDLPSNRYAEISVRMQALCEKYDLPYTTGPLHQQYGQALRTIIKLSLPNSLDQQRPARAARPGARPQAPDRRASARTGVPGARRLVAEQERRRGHDRSRSLGRTRVGHPVRAQPDLRCLRGVARPAGRVRRHAGGGRPQRLPRPADARGVRGGAAAPDDADPDWRVVTTAGFEFVRPAREDPDRSPTFQPNSLLGSA